MALLQNLESNVTIQEINLEQNQIDKKILEKIKQLLLRNKESSLISYYSKDLKRRIQRLPAVLKVKMTESFISNQSIDPLSSF